MQASVLKKLAALAITTLSLSAFSASSANCTKEPKSKWMAEKDINAKLVAQGLKVNRIKTEGSCYEAYVIAKDGKKSEMLINPVDGNSVGTDTNESVAGK
jgi:hypothetical protein